MSNIAAVVSSLPCMICRAGFLLYLPLGKQQQIEYAFVPMHTDKSDEELMQAYASGEAACFDLLYHRHKDRVYRYFLRQCADTSVVDDLFQDTWSNLIRARKSYTVTARFTTWLYQIAHNRLIDHFRRQNVRAVESLEDDPPSLSQASLERQLDSQKAVQQLYRLIAELPQDQRDAFLLKEEAGLSLEEIAAVTGTNRETVKSRLRYALQKLKQGLGWQDE